MVLVVAADADDVVVGNDAAEVVACGDEGHFDMGGGVVEGVVMGVLMGVGVDNVVVGEVVDIGLAV